MLLPNSCAFDVPDNNFCILEGENSPLHSLGTQRMQNDRGAGTAVQQGGLLLQLV